MDERKLLMDIKKLMKYDLPSGVIAASSPIHAKAEPIINERSSEPRGITLKQKQSKGQMIAKLAAKSPADLRSQLPVANILSVVCNRSMIKSTWQHSTPYPP